MVMRVHKELSGLRARPISSPACLSPHACTDPVEITPPAKDDATCTSSCAWDNGGRWLR